MKSVILLAALLASGAIPASAGEPAGDDAHFSPRQPATLPSAGPTESASFQIALAVTTPNPGTILRPDESIQWDSTVAESDVQYFRALVAAKQYDKALREIEERLKRQPKNASLPAPSVDLTSVSNDCGYPKAVFSRLRRIPHAIT